MSTAWPLVMLLATAAACSEHDPESAPYVPPKPGVVYRYQNGLTNRITAVEGWRTRFVDQRGRPGSRLALFIAENPQRPLTVDSAAFAALWPLELGKAVALETRQGDEVYRWEFRVTSNEPVTVPAGQYTAYVVQGIQVPKLVRDPKTAITTTNTWYYAPAIQAVVRFRTRYLGGPAIGREYASDLERVEQPAGAPSGDTVRR